RCRRRGGGRAAECWVIDEPLAETFLPRLAGKLLARGVELRGCPATCRVVAQARPAGPEDYDTEFLDLVLAVKVVGGLEVAIQHVNRHGSKHTDAIVTRDLAGARPLTPAVDSSPGMV